MPSNTLQDNFLKAICDQHISVSVFLVNGIKLHGSIEQFDHEVVMLRGSVTQMIYKHAISTVVPAKMIGVTEHSDEVTD